MGLAILPALAGSSSSSISWKVQGTPAGGIVSRLAISPSDPTILYALGANGVYASTDSGAAWTQVMVTHPDAPLDLAVDPLSPSTVYACGSQAMGLQKSTDGGKTWTEVDSGIALPGGNADTPASVTVDPVHEGVVYAGSYNTGVYKSSNGGKTWATINTGLSAIVGTGTPFAAVKVTVDAHNPQHLFLAVASADGSVTGTGVYASTDGGSHWSQVVNGVSIYSVTVDPNNDLNVYAAAGFATTGADVTVSVDGGGTWGAWANALADTRELVIDASDSNHMFALTFDGMSVTTDGGTSWNSVATGLPSNGVGTVEVMDLAIDPKAPANVYLGSSGFGAYKSIDGGTHWKLSDNGLTGLQFTGLAHDRQGNLYLGTTSSGVLRSSDKGATWYFVDTGLSGNGGLLIGSLVSDLAAPTTLYAVSSSSTALFKTVDGGQHWTKLELGGFAAAVDPQNDQIVYYGNGSVAGGMGKSIDGGKTWSVVSTGLAPNLVTALAVDPANGNVVFAGTENAGLFVTSDGGGSWQPARTGLPSGSQWVTAIAIDPATPSTVYVSFANRDIYKSTDGGGTWISSSRGMASEEVISSIQVADKPEVMYEMSDAGELYQSTDAGTDWSVVDTVSTSPAFTPAVILPVSSAPTNLYAGGTDGKVYLSSPVTTPPSGGSSSGGSSSGGSSSGGGNTGSGGGGAFPLLGSLLLLGFTALRHRR